MPKLKNIVMDQGRTWILILSEITGVSDWTDVKSKFVLYDAGVPDTKLIDVAGVIVEVDNEITFTIPATETDDLLVKTYKFEMIVYKDDKSLIQTAMHGECKINDILLLDPTI